VLSGKIIKNCYRLFILPDYLSGRQVCIRKACGIEEKLEAATGFEPVNNGFAVT
jgi:hypothetical protein